MQYNVCGVIMLKSISYILIFCLFGKALFKKIKLPDIICFLLVGILIGPFALDLIDEKISMKRF